MKLIFAYIFVLSPFCLLAHAFRNTLLIGNDQQQFFIKMYTDKTPYLYEKWYLDKYID